MADKAKEEAVVEKKTAKPKKEAKATKPAKAEKEEVAVEETVAEQPKEEVSLKESNPEKFLKDFNWHNYEEGIDPIDDGQIGRAHV